MTTIQRGLTRSRAETQTPVAPAEAQEARAESDHANHDVSAPVTNSESEPSRVAPTAVQQRESRARSSSVEGALRAQLDARTKVSNEALDATRVAVHDAVVAAVKRGDDAVEITRIAHQTATDTVACASPHASKQERADAAMAAASFALIGDGHIKDLEKVDTGRTSMVT